MVEKVLLEYFVPITESVELDGDFSIEGIAITETTTTNGHKFIAEELSKSANTLVGVPLLKDHKNEVDSIVGRVRAAYFNDELKNIPFKAVIKDDKMKKMVKDKLINSVSVGAYVDPNDIEEQDGVIIPHNIQFKELSLVAVPADSGATFDVALKQAFSNLKDIERGSIKMSEEETKTSKESESKEETEEETKEKSEEKSNEESEKESNEESDESKESESEKESEENNEVEERLKAIEAKVNKLESADVDEAKSDEKEDEEEDDEEDDEEVEEGYKIVQGHKSFSVVRDNYRQRLTA